MATIAALYRYPVKGLSAEPLDAVSVVPGETFPNDRAFAIENGPSGFDPAAPRYLKKAHFLMLMRNESLAALDTRFDDATGVLTVRKDGAVVAEGALATAAGRQAIEAFFDGYETERRRGTAKVLSAPGHSFSDSDVKVVSLISRDSLRDFERHTGAPVHPLRFRGNVYVEGLAPWEEFDWVGKTLRAGTATFAVTSRIDRCAATNVNPDTAQRDMTVPRTLLDAYGHPDCGVYLRVTDGGRLSVGDTIRIG